MNQCNVSQALQLTEEEIQTRLSTAEAHFEGDCMRSTVLRLRFMERLAEDLAVKNKTTKAAELKKLTNIAKQKKRASRIRGA